MRSLHLLTSLNVNNDLSYSVALNLLVAIIERSTQASQLGNKSSKQCLGSEFAFPHLHKLILAE